jgi:Ca-activated chloride channel homolog
MKPPARDAPESETDEGSDRTDQADGAGEDESIAEPTTEAESTTPRMIVTATKPTRIEPRQNVRKRSRRRRHGARSRDRARVARAKVVTSPTQATRGGRISRARIRVDDQADDGRSERSGRTRSAFRSVRTRRGQASRHARRGGESETVDRFDQLGDQPGDALEEGAPGERGAMDGSPAIGSGMAVMEQRLRQVEGDPSLLIRNQYRLEELRWMQSTGAPFLENRPW